ncbi:MAG: DUF2807 domain-containing protein [Gammaproteobacteria bacterium]|nr:DUF2807 domain-containing protein [Gammaproteobacteria bacterium]
MPTARSALTALFAWGFLLPLFLSLALGAPSALASPGYNRDYGVAPFERVYFSGTGTVNLIQGDSPAVNIEASQDVFDYLTVEAHDGALFIDTDGVAAEAAGRKALTINLTITNLRELVSIGSGVVRGSGLNVDDLTLEGDGAGFIDIANLRADELSVTALGATRFSLSGRVDRQVIDLRGSADYRAEALSSQSVEAQVSGAGNILLWVEEFLDVHVAGAARVRYSGSPYVSQRVSGPGSVGRINETFNVNSI